VPPIRRPGRDNPENQMLAGSGVLSRRHLRAALAALAAVFLIVLTACSSGSGSGGASGGTSGTAAASAAATLKGTPVNVMTIASVDYNGPTYANILATATVAGDWINAHGGIDGHPVNVTTCDEQGIPTKTAQCGRQAIQDHDVAVIGSFSLNGDAIIPELAAANVSWFGICCAVSADENTSPDVQQIGSGLALTPAVAVKMVADGCKNVALVLGDDGALAKFTETLFDNALKSVGASSLPVKTVLVPLAAQDYSPQVAQATAGTDCIFADLGEANFPSFMPSFVQSGAHQRLYGAQGNLDITVTKANAAATQDAVIAGSYSDISLPAWADFRAALTQYKAPNLNYNSLAGLGTWAAFMEFQKVAESISGSITNTSFLAAAQKATVDLPGLVPSFSFADKFTGLGGQFLTLVNQSVTFDVAHNGIPEPWDGGKFFNMHNALVGQPLSAANTPPGGESG
jgi:ABC-type branched-subunit amino acid transport system substrate-binding protein